MMKKNEYIKFDEETNLYVYIWLPSTKEVKGTIQIAHGMAEHLLRYDSIANFLNEQGYIVLGADHYAHGLTCGDPEKIGIVKKYDFMETIIKSINLVRHHYEDLFTGNNILLSHSMGSMTAQRYIELYPDDFSKLILSGSDYPSITYSLAKMLTKGKSKPGQIEYSKFIDGLSVGGFNKKFKKENDPNAWLSRDVENRKRYAEDPYCGKGFPVNYFYSLSKMLRDSIKKENLNQINKDLKIFIFQGEEDPVGHFTKGPKNLEKQYKKLGLDVRFKTYLECRHEVLNETLHLKEVYQDILDFIK